MIPILQKRPRDKRGDCFQACLASILEVPLEDIPPALIVETVHYETWNLYLRRVAKDYLNPKNLSLLPIGIDPAKPKWYPRGYAMLCITNPGHLHRAHCVVTLDGKLAWDPNPYKQPLSKKLYWIEVINWYK